MHEASALVHQSALSLATKMGKPPQRVKLMTGIEQQQMRLRRKHARRVRTTFPAPPDGTTVCATMISGTSLPEG